MNWFKRLLPASIRTDGTGKRSIPEVLLQQIEQQEAERYALGSEYAFEHDGDNWTWWCKDLVETSLPAPALVGEHQYRNAAGVLMVLHLLRDKFPIDTAQVREGLAEVSLPGRFHRLFSQCEYVMDVAHNL